MGRALEEQPPAEGAGRLAEGGPDESVEVVAAEERPRGELLAVQVRLVEAVLDEVEDAAQPVRRPFGGGLAHWPAGRGHPPIVVRPRAGRLILLAVPAVSGR